MKRLAAMLVAGWVAVASAQESAAPAMNFKAANARGGELRYNMDTGQMRQIANNAEIDLIPTNPAEPTLHIRASDKIDFTYAGDNTVPDTIIMTGKVSVDHPQGTITATRGEWSKNELIFTGNPAVMKRKDGGDLTAPQIKFNTQTGELSASGGFKATNVPLSMPGTPGAKAPANPYLLTTADITDWPAFIKTLKTQNAAPDLSPGKQILAQVDAKFRQFFMGMTEKTPNAPTQGDIIKVLNGVLKRPTLYDEAAWKGIALGPEADALLKKGKDLTSAELVQLNRRLIEAAFPNAIAKHP